MPVQNASELKALLFGAYGGYADKGYNPTNALAFTIDDRARVDYDAEGQLFYWFCKMSVHMEAEDRVLLSLRGGVQKALGLMLCSRRGSDPDRIRISNRPDAQKLGHHRCSYQSVLGDHQDAVQNPGLQICRSPRLQFTGAAEGNSCRCMDTEHPHCCPAGRQDRVGFRGNRGTTRSSLEIPLVGRLDANWRAGWPRRRPRRFCKGK